MGLRDRLIERAQRGMPDHAAEVTSLLDSDERLHAWAFGAHAAPERDKSLSLRGNRLLGAAVNAVMESRSKSTHMSAESDTCAAAIPRDGVPMFTGITNTHLGLWSFGLTNNETPPTQLVRFPRNSIRSIRKTGEETKGYGEQARLTFIDDSYVDVNFMNHDGIGKFWAACELFG